MRKLVVSVAAGVLAAVVAGCTGAEGTVVDLAPDGSVVTGVGSSPAVVEAFGKPVRDGDFEFVANKLECGKTTVGEYLPQKAKGQFCLLTLAVTNKSDQPLPFSGSDQRLIGPGGQAFMFDSSATVMHTPTGGQLVFEMLNPGVTYTDTLVFDVPKGTVPRVAELHDSSLSGGVRVGA